MISSRVLLATLVVLVASITEIDANHTSASTILALCASPPLDSRVTQEWVERTVPKDGWYVPLFQDSADNGRHGLSHRQGLPTRNLADTFCPRMTWQNQVGEYSAFGAVQFVFRCKTTNESYAFQSCDVTDPDDKDGHSEKANMYATLTDSDTYMFVLQCWEDGEQFWSLLTQSSARINDSTKEIVLNHVQSLGFNRNEYSEITYDKCP